MPKISTTWEQVYAIRATCPSRTVNSIAEEYGIPASTCASLLSGMTRKQQGYIPATRTWQRYKLTWEIVRSIRDDYHFYGTSRICLAERYNVSTVCIHLIVHNQTWCDPNYSVTPPKPRKAALKRGHGWNKPDSQKTSLQDKTSLLYT